MAPNHGSKYLKCVLTQKECFLFISGAFGAIWVKYNSNIHCQKPGLRKTILCSFAQTPGDVQGVWKIAKKKPNLIVKFCCVNEQKVVFFSQKIRFHFFQKNAKITRFVLLKMKNYTSTYILIYVLEQIFLTNNSKIIFSILANF